MLFILQVMHTARIRMNNTRQKAYSCNNVAKVKKFSLLDGGDDTWHTGHSFMEIFKIFVI